MVNGGSDQRSELGVVRYPYSLDIPYEQWGAKELLGVSQPSNSENVFSLHSGERLQKTMEKSSIFHISSRKLWPWLQVRKLLQLLPEGTAYINLCTGKQRYIPLYP